MKDLSATESTSNMNSSVTESFYNMTMSSNITLLKQNGTCVNEQNILLIFTIWDILDKVVVLVTNGGTLFIIYMHRYKMLEISSNIFIGCLTMADLASVVALPFRITSTYLPHSLSWNVSCFLSMSTAYVTSMVNTVTLCMIAVDRLIYIVQPLQYHLKMTPYRAILISIIIWIFCSLFTLIMFGLGYIDAYNVGMFGRPCRTTISVQPPLRRYLQFPFIIFVPITIGSYIKVGLVALKHRNMLAAAEGQQDQPGGTDFRITKVMLNVLSVYILCTLIIIAVPRIRDYMSVQENSCGVFFRVLYFIWRINTWLNPFIYVWKSEKFRKYVCGIFDRNLDHGSITTLI